MGFDIFLLPEYITASREKIMKKKIIILTSIFVFLSLVGGGIAAYYFSYLPMKKEAEEKLLDHEISKYIDNYYKLLEQQKFNEANIVLKNFRTFLKERESHTSLLAFYYSYIMENSLWYMQKNYEKMKANFPEMERYIKLFENKKYSSKELLFAKWCYLLDNCQYNYTNKNYKKALELLDDFVIKNGGEEGLKEKKMQILATIYEDKADILLKLGQTSECKRYLQKSLAITDKNIQRHYLYLKMADLELKYNKKPDFSQAHEYILMATEKYSSQKGYYFLAMIHLKMNRKEEAKRYYNLALSCKEKPLVNEEELTRLKLQLFK